MFLKVEIMDLLTYLGIFRNNPLRSTNFVYIKWLIFNTIKKFWY